MSDPRQRILEEMPLGEGPLSTGPAVGIDLSAPGGPDIVMTASDEEESIAASVVQTRAQRMSGPAPQYQVAAVKLRKSYRKGGVTIPVLKGVNLGVRRGEFLAIVGQSGSGKSTLLHLLGTLDAPDDGAIYFDGGRIDDLPSRFRDRLRNKHFGMIFQMYHLLPELTALENVLLPRMIGRSVLGFLRSRREHRAAAARLLDMVGLGHRLKHKPRELSGGEMQRAAIARALVAGPEVLLADEPTGNLDGDTGSEILRLLGSLNRQEKLTIVMVTHDQAIARRADRVVRLVDGRIEDV
ncbi:MAG TPA: ABC transporter ATP-binding protein [Thermoguttaceae bacterium]|nr:ABC transporter ATP-binding protein [Thermoguttaceae bacterium]